MILDLLSYLSRTVFVGLFATALLLLLRRRAAATQHAVASAGLLAILVLAPASFALNHQVKPVYTTPVTFAEISLPEAPAIYSVSSQAPDSVKIKPDTKAASAGIDPKNAFSLDPVVVFVTLWSLMAVVLCLRLLGGLAAVARRVSGSKPIALGLNVDTRVDAKTAVPLAVWWGRRVILLPSSWSSWSPERLNTVLKHEAAHLERGDCWIQFGASLACALAWPNPLAWWLAAKTRGLSEQAVDNLILASGVSPAQYAQDLLDIAQQSRDVLSGLALPMALKPEVSRRIEMILNCNKQRGSASLFAVSGLGLGFVCLAIGASTWSLVPAATMAKIRQSFPSPVRNAIAGLELNMMSLGTPAVETVPADIKTTCRENEDLAGKTSDAETLALEPKLDPPRAAQSSSLVDPFDGPDARSVRLDVFVMGPHADLSRFGLSVSSSEQAKGIYLSAEDLMRLRTYLTAQGAVSTIGGTHTTRYGHSGHGTSSNGRTKWAEKVLICSQPVKSSDLIYQVSSGEDLARGKTTFAVALPNGKVTAILRPSMFLKDRVDLWVFDPSARRARPPVPGDANSLHEWMESQNPFGLAHTPDPFISAVNSDQFQLYPCEMYTLGPKINLSKYGGQEQIKNRHGGIVLDRSQLSRLREDLMAQQASLEGVGTIVYVKGGAALTGFRTHVKGLRPKLTASKVGDSEHEVVLDIPNVYDSGDSKLHTSVPMPGEGFAMVLITESVTMKGRLDLWLFDSIRVLQTIDLPKPTQVSAKTQDDNKAHHPLPGGSP